MHLSAVSSAMFGSLLVRLPQIPSTHSPVLDLQMAPLLADREEG